MIPIINSKDDAELAKKVEKLEEQVAELASKDHKHALVDQFTWPSDKLIACLEFETDGDGVEKVCIEGTEIVISQSDDSPTTPMDVKYAQLAGWVRVKVKDNAKFDNLHIKGDKKNKKVVFGPIDLSFTKRKAVLNIRDCDHFNKVLLNVLNDGKVLRSQNVEEIELIGFLRAYDIDAKGKKHSLDGMPVIRIDDSLKIKVECANDKGEEDSDDS